MIYNKSSSILFLSKTTTLLVASFALLFILLNVDLPKSENHPLLSHQQIDTVSSFPDNNSFVNPFFRSDGESLPMDSIPTITRIIPTVKPFKSLNLRLHGIVYKNNNSGYAMISMHGAVQEIYIVNSEILDRVVVSGILRNQVIIDYFGKLYRLNIETPRYGEAVKAGLALSMSLAKDFALVEEDHRRNPIRLLMIRRPYPVYENGQFLGYIVMPGSNEDQFKRLGFKSGDIITYLNGTPLIGPGKAEYVITELTHSRNIDLTVLRGEDELSIVYGF